MKIALLVLLAAAPAYANPGYDEAFARRTDNLDDEPLAQDLRAAFGTGIADCTPAACVSVLREVACDARRCTAIDERHRNRAVTATGPAAARLGQHLLELGSATFEAGRMAVWRVGCAAGAWDPGTHDPRTTIVPRHGHCVAVLNETDELLADGLAPLQNSKLGGVTWTGRLAVTCTADTGPCRASCPSPAGPIDYYEQCTGKRLDIADAAFARALVKRAVALGASVQCRRWRDEMWDGGLVDVIGCGVAR